MGLFGLGKGKQTFGYERRRADVPPDGWIEAQALVDTCEAEATKTRYGTGGDTPGRVYRTNATYLVLDQQGGLLPIVVEAKLTSTEVPKQGSRLTVAYDPADPTDLVVLLSETELTERVTDYVRSAVRSGVEAPCEIVAASPTGRVSRPKAPIYGTGHRATVGAQPSPAPELYLTLRVSPPGAAPFEVSRFFWDRDLELGPGTRGTLFFLPDAPAHGHPVFPTQAHRAAGGDPVRIARDEWVQGWAAEGSSVTQGKVTISRGPVRFEG